MGKKTLNLKSTQDFSGEKVSVLLYGEPGAGKTTWASTWPNPVFLVPTIAETEMVALAHMDLPVIMFDTIEELEEQMGLLGKAIDSGDLVCDTLVIDNLTAIQLMIQQDLGISADIDIEKKDAYKFKRWSVYTSIFQRMLTGLHKLSPHIIWIAHSEITVVGDEVYGDIFMSGKAVKKMFKAFPTMMLEAVCKDMKAAGKQYTVRLKSQGIWTCKIKGDGEIVAKFPNQIPADYNELASLMGWRSREEVEEGGDKAKKKSEVTK